jgi:hypothetical protein
MPEEILVGICLSVMCLSGCDVLLCWFDFTFSQGGTDAATSSAPAQRLKRSGSLMVGPGKSAMIATLQQNPETATPSFVPSKVNVEQSFIDKLKMADERFESDSDSDSDESKPPVNPAAAEDSVVVELPSSDPLMNMSRADVVQLELSSQRQQIEQAATLERTLSRMSSFHDSDPKVSRQSIKEAVSTELRRRHSITSISSDSKDDAPPDTAPAQAQAQAQQAEVKQAMSNAENNAAQEELQQAPAGKAFVDWLRAGGMALSLFTISLFCVAQLARIYSDWCVQLCSSVRRLSFVWCVPCLLFRIK